MRWLFKMIKYFRSKDKKNLLVHSVIWYDGKYYPEG